MLVDHQDVRDERERLIEERKNDMLGPRPVRPLPRDPGCSAVTVAAWVTVLYADGCYLLASKEIGRSLFVPRIGETVNGIAGENDLLVDDVEWNPLENNVTLALTFQARLPGYEKEYWEGMGWRIEQDVA